MSDDDLNKFQTVVREEITEALQPINNKLGTIDTRLGHVEVRLDHVETRLDHVETKIDALWDQTVKVTEELGEIRETIDSQTQLLNQSKDNTQKLDKRVTKVEANLGMPTPPELQLID